MELAENMLQNRFHDLPPLSVQKVLEIERWTKRLDLGCENALLACVRIHSHNLGHIFLANSVLEW